MVDIDRMNILSCFTRKNYFFVPQLKEEVRRRRKDNKIFHVFHIINKNPYKITPLFVPVCNRALREKSSPS